jgi:tetratricopeptide (TPR) repeat protein
MDDREQMRLLRSALSALHHHRDDLGPRGLELWADLERELGFLLLLNGERPERDDLLHRSLERARAIEPARPRAVARALLGLRYAELDPRQLRTRIDEAREVLSMPARTVGSEVRLAAHCYLHEDLLRLREWSEAEHTLAQAERLAERYPHSYWTWAVRTWRALSLLRVGQVDGAESAAFAAAAMRPGIVEAEACLAVKLTNIRLEQGRAGEMVATLAGAAAAHPEIPTYRAVHALCAAESGDHDTARDLVAAFDAQGFETLPDDPNRFLGLAVLAHAAASVGDRPACARLRELLDPYGDQWVVLQCYGGGGATWGPTAHALARLARTLGHHDEAEELFDRARLHAAASPPTLARIERDRQHP